MPITSARPLADSPNPGAGMRATAELVRDPARSDRLIAEAARCEHKLVHRLRRELEAGGTIPATAQRTQRTPPPRKPGRARLAIEAAGPDATASQIARQAGVTYQAAWQALRTCEPTATAQDEQACAADALSVTVLTSAICPQCRQEFGYDRHVSSARIYCGLACRTQANREQIRERKHQARQQQGTSAGPALLPVLREPDWDRGLCTREGGDFWTSDEHADRRMAIRICRECPLMMQCRQWSLRLPVNDFMIYGGWTSAQRRRYVRAQRAAARLSCPKRPCALNGATAGEAAALK